MQQIDDTKTERLVMSVEEAGAALGISRATAYNLVNQGRLPSIRISDRRIIIPRKAIDELLASAGKHETQDNSAGNDNGNNNGHSSGMH